MVARAILTHVVLRSEHSFDLKHAALLSPLDRITTAASSSFEVVAGAFTAWDLSILVATEIAIDTVASVVVFVFIGRHFVRGAVGPRSINDFAVVFSLAIPTANTIRNPLVGTGDLVCVWVAIAAGTYGVGDSYGTAAFELADIADREAMEIVAFQHWSDSSLDGRAEKDNGVSADGDHFAVFGRGIERVVLV